MIVICKKHGPSPGCLVSSDLAKKIVGRLPIFRSDYVRIDYVFDGELAYTGDLAYTFHFSSEDAARVGFLKSEQLPLTEYDEHPEKTRGAVPECSSCLQELLAD